MLKKSLLSLAIAAGMGLAGCSGTDGTGDVGPNGGNPNQGGVDQATQELIQNPGTYPLFDPAVSVVPVPSDILLSGTTDGTLVMSGETDNSFQFIDPTTGATGANFNPVTNALADSDGASVSAQIDLPFSGGLDASTVVANQTVFLVPLADCRDANGNDLDPVTGCLANGSLSHIDTANPANMFGTTPNFRAEVITHTGGTGSAVLRITPLEPLQGATRYMVFMTNGIKDSSGKSVKPSLAYHDLGSDSYLASSSLEALRTLIQGYEQLASGYVAATLTPAITNYLTFLGTGGTSGADLSAENRALLADLGVDLSSVVSAETAQAAILQAAGATPGSVVLSYSFTTGGTNEVLSVNTAPALAGLSSGVGSAIQAALAHPTVNSRFNAPQARAVNITKQETVEGMTVHIGTVDLPYYLSAPSFYQDLAKAADPAEQLTAANVIAAKWSANDQIDDLATDLGAGFEAFGAFTPPTNKVTRHFPFAQSTGTLQAPIAVFMPAGTPTQTIIYQHGVTKNRTIATSFAKQMTDAGYAVVAMDLTLHGLEPTDFVDATGLIRSSSKGAQFSPLSFTTVDMTSKAIVAATSASASMGTTIPVADVVTAVLTPAAFRTGTQDALVAVYDIVSNSVAAIDDAVTTVAAFNANNANPAPNETQVALATAYATVAATEDTSTLDSSDSSIAAALAYNGYQTATLGQYMVNESHFGLTTDDGRTPRAIAAADLTDNADESGSLFVYPLHFQITRDNQRQAVMNLLNLGASLGNISTAVGTTLPQHDGTKSLVNLVAHSFGSFVGASYASVNNTLGFYNVNNNAIVGGLLDQVNGLPTGTGSTLLNNALVASGGNVTCGNVLSEVATATGSTEANIQAALSAAGVELSTALAIGCGNSNLPHLQTVTLANPGGALAKLNENSQVYAPPVLGALSALGIPQSSSSFETFLSSLQATLDSVDPLALSGGFKSPLVTNTTGVLSIMVEDDKSVPNSAVNESLYIYSKAPLGTALPAPLTGTEPLNVSMGLTNVTAGVTGNGTAPQQVAVRFVTGASHGSFELNSLLTASPETVEQEMAALTQSLIATSGTVVQVGTQDAAAIESETTVTAP